jgi:hypothetical protein
LVIPQLRNDIPLVHEPILRQSCAFLNLIDLPEIVYKRAQKELSERRDPILETADKIIAVLESGVKPWVPFQSVRERMSDYLEFRQDVLVRLRASQPAFRVNNTKDVCRAKRPLDNLTSVF